MEPLDLVFFVFFIQRHDCFFNGDFVYVATICVLFATASLDFHKVWIWIEFERPFSEAVIGLHSET